MLGRQPRCRRAFRGCFPADRIPGYDGDYPFGMVVNTDPAHLAGSHWTVVWVESGESAEYFDSFGQPPPSPHIDKYLAQFARVQSNSCELQSVLSQSCGKYAIYFIMRRCAGDTFKEIVGRLRGARSLPDRLVCGYVSRLLRY